MKWNIRKKKLHLNQLDPSLCLIDPGLTWIYVGRDLKPCLDCKINGWNTPKGCDNSRWWRLDFRGSEDDKEGEVLQGDSSLHIGGLWLPWGAFIGKRWTSLFWDDYGEFWKRGSIGGKCEAVPEFVKTTETKRHQVCDCGNIWGAP